MFLLPHRGQGASGFAASSAHLLRSQQPLPEKWACAAQPGSQGGGEAGRRLACARCSPGPGPPAVPRSRSLWRPRRSAPWRRPARTALRSPSSSRLPPPAGACGDTRPPDLRPPSSGRGGTLQQARDLRVVGGPPPPAPGPRRQSPAQSDVPRWWPLESWGCSCRSEAPSTWRPFPLPQRFSGAQPCGPSFAPEVNS